MLSNIAKELIDRLQDSRIIRSGPARIDMDLKRELLAFLTEVMEKDQMTAFEAAQYEEYKYAPHPCDLADFGTLCPNYHRDDSGEEWSESYDCDCPAYGFCGFVVALAVASTGISQSF